jgi:ribonuclease VapC
VSQAEPTPADVGQGVPTASVVVVDTSAALAIMFDEPEGRAVRAALKAVSIRLMSTATAIELGVVLQARRGASSRATLDRFLRTVRIELVDVDQAQVDRALTAWQRFGKGNHPARLNLGDLFTYALADAPGRAILCVGDDFAATDLPVVPGRTVR